MSRIITADQARKMTDVVIQRQNEVDENKLKDIWMVKIQETISKGEKSFYYDETDELFDLTPYINDRLNELGYNVKRETFKNETSTTISWK